LYLRGDFPASFLGAPLDLNHPYNKEVRHEERSEPQKGCWMEFELESRREKEVVEGQRGERN
jgi:hypothetical protein